MSVPTMHMYFNCYKWLHNVMVKWLLIVDLIEKVLNLPINSVIKLCKDK